MKILGIDYGSKRIGLAISDEGLKFAFPKKVISNDLNTLNEISKVIKDEEIFQIVIGESLDLAGVPNVVQIEIEDFIQKLGHNFNLPIRREKEFFTSVEARPRQGKDSLNARKTRTDNVGRVDASAAALILQRFLDKRNNGLK